MAPRVPLLALLCLASTVPAAEPATGRDRLIRADEATFELHGPVGEQVRAVTHNWLLRAPADNPAMRAMFADRDHEPYRDLLPWSGEFAGKYLTGATQVLRLTSDPGLRKHLEGFVAQLISLQADDGYLGPYPKAFRLTGKATNVGGGATWDAWGHYHAMLGLLTWHELTGDEQALACARRIGDLLCAKFLGPDKYVVDTGNAEMNQAVAHSLALLHARTGEQRYLDLATEVVDEFARAGAGDYLRAGLAGKAFYQCPKPRWESLHPILALAELHRINGNADYRKAFENLWWSIAEHDRHNNGGFSSGEQAQGNPYHPGAIETCCTIAWMAMGVEMLKLTGDSVVADELELSTLNQVVGLHSADGKWCTYNTPMVGRRIPSTEDIAFQIRPGSEQLNCCSVNAARGFGMIAEWALMRGQDGLVLNWYGPGMMAARLDDVNVRLEQETDYPRGGAIKLKVLPERPAEFTLNLRVPHWSANTRVTVNGRELPDVTPGRYLAVRQTWRRTDEVTIKLDMTPHAWAGDRECADKVSLYRGPLLLAHEPPAAQGLNFTPHWKHFGELSAANENRAAVEWTFEGEGLKWFGKRYDDGGRAAVSIDGKRVSVVDQYGPGRDLPFEWEHKGLAAGRHTVRIEVLGEKAEASKGTWNNITGFGPAGAAKPTVGVGIAVPTLDLAALNWREVAPADGAVVGVEVDDAEGRVVRLRDFGTAGRDRRPYATWLGAKNATPVAFSRQSPLRSRHLAAAAPGAGSKVDAERPASLPTEDGFRGIWYSNQPQDDQYRFKYSGGFATYPQQHIPLAVYCPRADKTFFAYGGRGKLNREILNLVSFYDHKTGQVTRPRVVLRRGTNDAHYNPTLAVDDAGYVYVFCNSHGRGAELGREDPTFGRSYIFRSVRPGSIESFERVRDDNFSYSQAWSAGGRLLWLHTRYVGNARRLFWSASADGRKWSEPSPLAEMAQGSYQVSWAAGERVATALDHHPSKGGLNARTNIYYLETRDGGATWTTPAGERLTLPLRETSNPARVRDYEAEGKLVYLKDLAFDADGWPVILYLTSGSYKAGPAGGERVWHTARWTGAAWAFAEVARSDHNYDHGSLYVDGRRWRVMAPTEPGPQPWMTGGAVAVWASDDEGRSWRKERVIGAFNGRNQTYVRRPFRAHRDLYAFWADGDAMGTSESDLFVADSDARVFRLPRQMDGETAAPVAVAP